MDAGMEGGCGMTFEKLTAVAALCSDPLGQQRLTGEYTGSDRDG